MATAPPATSSGDNRGGSARQTPPTSLDHDRNDSNDSAAVSSALRAAASASALRTQALSELRQLICPITSGLLTLVKANTRILGKTQVELIPCRVELRSSGLTVYRASDDSARAASSATTASSSSSSSLYRGAVLAALPVGPAHGDPVPATSASPRTLSLSRRERTVLLELTQVDPLPAITSAPPLPAISPATQSAIGSLAKSGLLIRIAQPDRSASVSASSSAAPPPPPPPTTAGTPAPAGLPMPPAPPAPSPPTDLVFSASDADVMVWLRAINALQAAPSLLADTVTLDQLELPLAAFQKPLGHGSFGVVLRGHLARSGQPRTAVAVKLLRGDWTAPSADSIFDFVQEAHILHMLDHPHLMHAYGVCYFTAGSLPEETPFSLTPVLGLVCEYLAGGDLKTRIHTLDPRTGSAIGPAPQPLTLSQYLRLAREIVSGLQFLHAHGLIHRDLKPENVMFDAPDGCAKIVDFGHSRRVAVDRQMTANVRGSLLWRAPEMMSGSPSETAGLTVARLATYGCEADIYALGIMFWEMMTGLVPYDDVPDTWDLIERVRNGSLRPPLADARIPPRLATLMKWCWCHEAAARPSAEEVAAWLSDDMIISFSSLGDDSPGEEEDEEVGRGQKMDEHRRKAAEAAVTAVVTAPAAAPATSTPARANRSQHTGSASVDAFAAILAAIGERAVAPGPGMEGDIPALVVALRQSVARGGLELRERTWLAMSFPPCFTGQSLVDWLCDTCRLDEESAGDVAKRLHRLHFFRHTVKSKGFSRSCFFFWTKDADIDRLLVEQELVRLQGQ